MFLWTVLVITLLTHISLEMTFELSFTNLGLHNFPSAFFAQLPPGVIQVKQACSS